VTDAVDGIAKILQQLTLRAFLRFDLVGEDKAQACGWSSSDIQPQRHRVALRRRHSDLDVPSLCAGGNRAQESGTILVIDEVLVVGDAAFRERCANKIKELLAHGATVVLVQHNMEAILQMSHRCMWLDKGEVKMIGIPQEVVKTYLASRNLPMVPLPADMAVPIDPTTGPLNEAG